MRRLDANEAGWFNVAMPDASAEPKRCLIVSYWYPPSVGAAAERMYSFARYLPAHGWTVKVLTSGRASSPGDVIYVPDPTARAETAFPDFDPRHREAIWKRWARDFVWPDRFRFWMRAATRAGTDVCPLFKPDVILASFPPASAVVAALELQKQTGGRLVLDYRDRWMGPGGYMPRWGWSRRRHEELERNAVRQAAGLVAVSEAMADAISMEQDYPRSRIAVIPNGYEEESASGGWLSVEATQRSLTIVHVGTVIARNRPESFLTTLARLRGSTALEDARFRFVGNLSREYIASLGLMKFVETTGLVPREAAREAIHRAPALLLLVGDYVGRWGHNAKVFEYVRSGRPILCLEESPDSNDGRLLRQFAGGRSFFARLGDEAGLTHALAALRVYLEKSPESVRTHPAAFERYRRAGLAGELAAFLNRVC